MTKILIGCSVIVGISVIVLVFASLEKNKNPKYALVVVEKTNIKQEVSATGKVNPAQAVDLSFETAGKIASVKKKVGDQVLRGDMLASLANSELIANLNQYEADSQAQQAALNELLAGTRPEELALAQTKVKNNETALQDSQVNLENVRQKAEIDLNNIYDDTSDILQTAYLKADDALNKQIDDLFNNDATDNPKLSFDTANSQAGINSQIQRVEAGKALFAIKATLNDLATQNKMDFALETAENNLKIIRDFLNVLSEAVNEAMGTSQTIINTYKGYVTTARTNVNTELSNLNSQKQDILGQRTNNQNDIAQAQASLNTAQSNLQTAKDELTLKLAGSTQEQIEAQQAKLKSSQANVQNTKAKIQKTALTSPIDGLVAKIEAKIGELVQVNEVIASIISEAQFEIVSNIPEVDIAKIKIGDIAKVTLDTYGQDVVFEAVVSSVDLKETTIEGVSTYKTVLQFTGPDQRIKAGLTANIDILTAEKQAVIAVPSRAIIAKNGSKIVKVLGANNKIQEVSVELGLKGSDGKVEVISGLKEGDKIITSF